MNTYQFEWFCGMDNYISAMGTVASVDFIGDDCQLLFANGKDSYRALVKDYNQVSSEATARHIFIGYLTHFENLIRK